MSNTTPSPNMGMPTPTVGVDPGPDWATDLNACLSVVDSHNHTSGQGVQITPQGIDINADLPMNNNDLTSARSVRFQPQTGAISAATDLGCLYENGVDLYYIDGAGNQVRITQSGSVTGSSGTITGLPSGTASASFAAATFTFQSATNTPATMNVGPIITGAASASPKTVTISASGSQPANYVLVWPLALPSTTSSLTVDASGNMATLALAATTYNPTFSNAIGGSSYANPGVFMATRIGNNVTVAGKISFTSSGQLSSVEITLPIARTDGSFTAVTQGSGTTGFAPSGGTSTNAGTVEAVIGGQTVLVKIESSSGNTAGAMDIVFMYSLTNV